MTDANTFTMLVKAEWRNGSLCLHSQQVPIGDVIKWPTGDFEAVVNCSHVSDHPTEAQARAAVEAAVRQRFGATPDNPDDVEIACPHVHLYREGFGDRWAFPISPEVFTQPTDHWQTLVDFMRFCNITRPPEFDRGLFT